MELLKHDSEEKRERMFYKESETTKMIEQYNKFWFICCCPDFWVKKVYLPDSFVKVYRPIIIVIHAVMVVFCSSCTLSLWTQHSLSQSQKADRLAYGVSTPIITVFYHFIIMLYTEDIKTLLYKLVVVLKADYNDRTAEQEMIRQSKLHNGIFFSSCVCNLVFVGMYNCIKAVTTDATFVTCISAWPDIEDRSVLAGATRVVVYFLWFDKRNWLKEEYRLVTTKMRLSVVFSTLIVMSFASKLPHAIYGSGWQCCYDRSSRVRKLVVIAMMQAQRPIELKAFGHFIFSYETYVAIVK